MEPRISSTFKEQGSTSELHPNWACPAENLGMTGNPRVVERGRIPRAVKVCGRAVLLLQITSFACWHSDTALRARSACLHRGMWRPDSAQAGQQHQEVPPYPRGHLAFCAAGGQLAAKRSSPNLPPSGRHFRYRPPRHKPGKPTRWATPYESPRHHYKTLISTHLSLQHRRAIQTYGTWAAGPSLDTMSTLTRSYTSEPI